MESIGYWIIAINLVGLSACIIGCSIIMEDKGYSGVLGMLVGFGLGPFGFLLSVLIRDKTKRKTGTVSYFDNYIWKCRCGKTLEFKVNSCNCGGKKEDSLEMFCPRNN